MKAIVFADRRGEELEPLCRHTCPALLHVAGKPVIEHTVEDLARAGVTDLVLVVCPQAAELQRLVAAGSRWGVSVSYATSRPQERASAVIARLNLKAGKPFLCIRGDVIRGAMVEDFLVAAGKRPWSGALHARAGCSNAWLMLVDAPSGDFEALNPEAVSLGVEAADCINLPGRTVEPLRDCQGFFRACLKSSSGRLRGLEIAGFEIGSRERHGRFSRAPGASYKVRFLQIGNYVQVADSVEISGLVVIGDRCLIDENTSLMNCVVLPGTYVGAGLTVRNAIIGSGFMMCMDAGVTVPLDDQLWVADMRSAAGGESGLNTRLAATGLLLASLPLWPLAFLAALSESFGAPIRQRILIGNKRSPEGAEMPFNTFEFATRIPLLCKIPLLLAAISGDLRLFGARPNVEGSGLDLLTDWECTHERLPVGILGPQQLHLGKEAPEEEIYLNEVIFNENRGLRNAIARMRDALALLVSSRAWFPSENRI